MHTLAAATIYRRWSEPSSVHKASNRPSTRGALGWFACSSRALSGTAASAWSRTARAAAPTSSDLVIGRPTTIRVAPAAIASAGVATLVWSSRGADRSAGRTPGQISSTDGPRRARRAAASSGEQTIARQPRPTASSASRGTASAAGGRPAALRHPTTSHGSRPRPRRSPPGPPGSSSAGRSPGQTTWARPPGRCATRPSAVAPAGPGTNARTSPKPRTYMVDLTLCEQRRVLTSADRLWPPPRYA